MERYFIRDCTGKIIGNPLGYKTHASALAQCNKRGYSVYSQIWKTFYKNEEQNKSIGNNLIYSIKLESV